MTTAKKLIKAAGSAAGAAEVTYVDDVFSTYLYKGTAAVQGIQNGINLGDFGVGTSTRFDRNVDFLSRSSDLTGNADGKTLTFSCWVFLTPKFDDNPRTLYATDSNDNGVLFQIQSDNTLGMEAWNGGVRTLQLTTTTTISTNVWTHILVSLDFANSSNRYIYFNDVAASVIYNTYNNANIEFTRSTHYVGIWGNGTTRGLHDDSLAHMYLDYTYRDLSTESNRRIFIDANGGSTSASSLTALNPIMYLPMTTAYAVGKNAGTGGDFTSNGSPTIVENGTEYVADSGKGGLVWAKSRDSSGSQSLYDTERGVQKALFSNTTSPTQDDSSGGATKGLYQFNSNGFTVGDDWASAINLYNNNMVAWTFRKQPGFFDVVTYTGTGVARTISHNLGSVPGVIITKRLDSTSDWAVYHRSYGSGGPAGILNGTDAAFSLSTYWNNTDPTSTEFTLGSFANVNASGGTYVAYLFAHDAQDFGTDSDESIIKCGSYTGTGAAGNEIDLGWEPQWLLVKSTTTASDSWIIMDTMRGIVTGESGPYLWPNSSSQEYTANMDFDVTPTGFRVNTTHESHNGSGEQYIYMAIRRPHKPASEFAATDLFAMDGAGNSTEPAFTSGFPVDMAWRRNPTDAASNLLYSRLNSDHYLVTDDSLAETADPNGKFDYPDGWNSATNLSTMMSWMWRRAPGFFDVVTYTGNQTNRTIPHNLGVEPEMMWVKCRSQIRNWMVYSKDLGPTRAGILQLDFGFTSDSESWNNTASTATDINLGSSASTNFADEQMIAYLFASADGISKIGNYTGTGSDLNIDCGFSAGARFVLIKRTDASGDWYLWDSVRGIVAGNDPYLVLNTASAQVTNTDYIDPLSSGFTITSSAPAELNASSGTYIFYAIA